MPVYYREGDIFLSRAKTLAHGVNCKGRMRNGVAVQFRLKFPKMYKQYKNLCHRNELNPGDVFLYKDSDPWVLNLATQADLGGAKLEYIEKCLEWIAENYKIEGIQSIAIPRIGAGLGRLNWREVKGIINRILDDMEIPVYVYEEFEK